MIVLALMNIFKQIFTSFLSVFDLPDVPAAFNEALDSFLEFLINGSFFFKLVFPINLVPFFYIFLSIFSFGHAYDLVMWILKKLPILGIK